MSTLSSVVIRDDGQMSALAEDGTPHITDLKILMTDRYEMAPQGCKFVGQTNGQSIFVVEQPPCVRTIHLCAPAEDQWQQLVESGRVQKYRLGQRAREQREFQLAFPFVVFIVAVDATKVMHLRVFFRDQPIMSLTDHLFLASMSSDDLFPLCLQMEDVPVQDRLPAGLVQRAIEAFWQQEFSLDLGARYRQSIPFLETLWDWQEHSRGDYLWMLRAPWTPCGTINDQVSTAPKVQNEELSSHMLAHRTLQAKVLSGTPSAQPALSEQGNHRPLPTFSVLLRNQMVRLGDALCASGQRAPGVDPRKEYVVSAFLTDAKKDSQRIFVQFEGLDEVFFLGTRGNGMEGWKPVEAPADPFIKEVPQSVVEGVVLRPDAMIFLKNNKDIALPAGKYKIRKVFLDKDGDTLVLLVDGKEPVYVTYQGGTLIPSVDFGVPRVQGQRFHYLDAEISVGQIVEITAEHPSLKKGSLVRVASLRKDEQGRDRFLVAFEGMEGNEIVLFEQGKLLVQWKNCLHRISETKVILDQHEIELSKRPLLFLRTARAHLQGGKVYRVVGIEASKKEGRHPLDTDLFVEGATNPLSLILNGQKKIPFDDLIFVPEEFKDFASIFFTLRDKGREAGKDVDGKPLRIGDMVMITKRSFNDVRFDPTVQQQVGIIVNACDFLYVLYSQDLAGEDGYLRHHTRGYESLQKDFDRPRRIQLVLSRDCCLVATPNP